jgi:hypothetical protein
MIPTNMMQAKLVKSKQLIEFLIIKFTNIHSNQGSNLSLSEKTEKGDTNHIKTHINSTI